MVKGSRFPKKQEVSVVPSTTDTSKISRGDWIRTSDHTPPRRVL